MIRERQTYIDVLRMTCMICVISFHIFGRLDDLFRDSFLDKSAILYGSAILVQISVAMFMFLAGYCYRKPQRKDVLMFLLKKIKRLLIPYLVFSCLIMFSTGFFDVGELLGGGFYHLWFLTALFWCFMFSMCIDYSHPNSLLLLPISLILIAIHLPNLFGLQDFVKWYFYFVVGALMHSYNSLETFISKNITCIICLIIAIGIFVFTPALKYREGSIIHAIATCLLICILFCLVKKRWNNKQGLKVNAAFIYVVGNSSMGIYIFHFWVLIFMLSSTSIRLFHLNKLVEHVSYPFGRKLDNCKFSDKFCSYSASKKDSLRLLAVGRKLYK
jgi:hypothetical protein